MRYLGNYRREALIPYLFLIIATLAQLAVPRMVGNIIDAISQGVIARSVLDGLERIPQTFLPLALTQILEFLGLPAEWTLEQLRTAMDADLTNVPSALLQAGIAIVIFAAIARLFRFPASLLGGAQLAECGF